MEKYNRGFAVPLLLAIISILIIGSGTYIYTQKTSNDPQNEVISNTQNTQVEQNTSQNQPSVDWQLYTNSQYGFEVKYPAGWKVLPSLGTLSRIAFGQIKNIGSTGYDGEWFVFVYSDSETNIDDMRKSLGDETEKITINGVSAFRLVKDQYESILIKMNGMNYWIHNGNIKNDLFSFFYNSLKFSSVGALPTNAQQANTLRVSSFFSATTFDVDGVGHPEIVQKFGDGTTIFYLNVKKPLVTFYLNEPANPSSVNSDSIIVKVNGTVLSGATAKAVTEQGFAQGATFPMYAIQVDLSGITNLKNYAGQNIQIILTDKIKDAAGNPLQQCTEEDNKGECVADALGQKIKVFGVELKAYSL